MYLVRIWYEGLCIQEPCVAVRSSKARPLKSCAMQQCHTADQSEAIHIMMGGNQFSSPNILGMRSEAALASSSHTRRSRLRSFCDFGRYSPTQDSDRDVPVSSGEVADYYSAKILRRSAVCMQSEHERSDVEEVVCRICRLEAEPGNPLFHPCKCSGTIKFVHQDCLNQWLKHSGHTHCEVCFPSSVTRCIPGFCLCYCARHIHLPCSGLQAQVLLYTAVRPRCSSTATLAGIGVGSWQKERQRHTHWLESKQICMHLSNAAPVSHGYCPFPFCVVQCSLRMCQVSSCCRCCWLSLSGCQLCLYPLAGCGVLVSRARSLR